LKHGRGYGIKVETNRDTRCERLVKSIMQKNRRSGDNWLQG